TPLGERTLVPWCATPGEAEPGRWYAAALVLGCGGRPPVIGEGKITWPDGTIDDVPEPETATFPGLSK
ncbi:hypothetical protein ACFQKO_49120, partial [Nonomuraea rubra]